jgi:hypothetical protein
LTTSKKKKKNEKKTPNKNNDNDRDNDKDKSEFNAVRRGGVDLLQSKSTIGVAWVARGCEGKW